VAMVVNVGDGVEQSRAMLVAEHGNDEKRKW
jgi:hypothetical protein